MMKIIAVPDLLRDFDEVLSSVERGEPFEIRAADGHAIALLLPIQDEAQDPTDRSRRAATRRLSAGVEALSDQMRRDATKHLGT
ncbi:MULTISPECIES: hypothetical protein [Mycolicibacterium]|nr:hypothetical protein [Mycolicibacterium fortuitum]UBV14606.1 hypothetical protein H8Z57_28485 [Mycolicibacterium fortuitum]